MKAFSKILSALALTLMTMNLSANAQDKDGYILTDLWKSYSAALEKDKPKEQLSILEKIKKQASERRLTWDYYQACCKYADVKSAINWKDREKAVETRDKEIEEYGDPVAILALKPVYDVKTAEYILANKARLLTGHNTAFYKNGISGSVLEDVIVQFIRNDYDYALMYFISNHGRNVGSKVFDDEVKKHFEGIYPLDALSDYIIDVKEKDDSGDAAGKFLAKYQGKAASLLGRQDILLKRYNHLRSDKDASGDDFLSLKKDCEAFIKEQASFSGKEKDIAGCCTAPGQILEELQSHNAGYSIKDGRLELRLRNLDKVRFQILDGKKKIYDEVIKNPQTSFYVIDTIPATLPAFDDGDYDIVLKADGMDDIEDSYSKHSLSFAVRKDSKGYGIFAADHISGEPVKEIDITLKDRKGQFLGEAKGVRMDGFTPLPATLASKITSDSRYISIQVSCKGSDAHLRTSDEETIYTSDYTGKTREDITHCTILTDRSAFNPDETVRFKVVLYQGTRKFKVLDGEPLTAILRDTEGNEISRQSLTTNAFGSAAGDFVLTRGKKNGQYSIQILQGNRVLTTRYLLVDDIVLPTFALVWDKEEKQFEPGDTVNISGTVRSYSGHGLGAADITYSVTKYGDEKAGGKLITDASGRFSISFPSDKEDRWQNYYITIKAVDATGETQEFNHSVYVIKKEEDKPAEYYFEAGESKGDSIDLKVTAGKKATWAVVELFGTDCKLLDKKIVHFEPAGGDPASTLLHYDYDRNYPDVVTLSVLYFQNSNEYSYQHIVRRPDDSWRLPLRFTRFSDKTLPGAGYEFIISTEPGVECTATIFDKSTESFRSNRWDTIMPALQPASSIRISSCPGRDDASSQIYSYGNYIPLFQFSDMGMVNEEVVMAYGAAPRAKAATRAVAMSNDATLGEAMMDYKEEVAEETEEEAIPSMLPPEEGYVRKFFANTIAWEPALVSDKDGRITFKFTNADKLSTYYVQLFVHDKSMRNNVLRREMMVTIPVKVSVVQPQVLYDGDSYVLNATLSNSTDTAVSGTVKVEFSNGGCSSSAITVPANGAEAFKCSTEIGGADDLGIKITFTADNKDFGSDAIFVKVPVLKADQEITEAHSAVLLSGADREALIKELRSRFVNMPGADATIKEISIRQMLEEAIPQRIEPKSDNVVSLTEALFAQYLLDGSINESVMQKILACQKPDGGFAWFKEMESSQILTVLVLQRFALMNLKENVRDAVDFLDKTYFSTDKKPYWCGWISLQQYAYVRSLYTDVPFSAKGIDAKVWKEFKKDMKSYLAASNEKDLKGRILAKARRIKTLQALGSSEQGISLAKAWGVKIATGSKLERTLHMDMESLVEYAVAHKSGGIYFPNAVMPFRGLIESELYAHSMLCDLLDENGHKDLADGIRLWLMVQKETQKWEDDPAYIEALNSVFHGSDELLDTKVIALKGSTTLPFKDIKAAGNGFTIERQYFRDGKLLQEGDELHVGDRITAEYKVWSEENRSFVRLTASRCAALRPVQQMSGYQWGCYRSVLKDRSEFWFDVYPEENTTRTEEFYVTQEGRFQSPVTTIECLYADHYRANDNGGAVMTVNK